MFQDILDPNAAASALLGLAEALKRDPASLARRPSFGTELFDAARATRVWATKYAVPAACIPHPPGPEDLTPDRAVEFLVDLAEVLLYIGARAIALDSMAGVVKLLRAQDAAAVVELHELEFAVSEVLQHLRGVSQDAERLDSELERFAGTVLAPDRTREVAERAARIRIHLDHVVLCLRDLRSGIEDWQLSDGARPKNGDPPS